MALMLIVEVAVAVVFLLNYLNRYTEAQRRQLFQERGVATRARIIGAKCFTVGGRTTHYYCKLIIQYHDQQNACYTVETIVPDSPNVFLYLPGDELPIWYNPQCPEEIELITPPRKM